jgi:hypothetical protein
LALVVGAAVVAGPAGAAKPQSGAGGSATSGSCSVTPSPVAIGADWTLRGSNLGAYALVNVLITDAAGGINAWNLQADASGATSVTWHSYAAGTSNVKMNESSRRKTTTVAACSFAVR